MLLCTAGMTNRFGVAKEKRQFTPKLAGSVLPCLAELQGKSPEMPHGFSTTF
jgi:hypothetical protein